MRVRFCVRAVLGAAVLASLGGCSHLRMPEESAWSWDWKTWIRRGEPTADEALKADAAAGDAAAQYALGFSLL